MRLKLLALSLALASPLAAQQLVLSRSNAGQGLFTVNTSTGTPTAIPGTATLNLSGLGSQTGGEVVGHLSANPGFGRRVTLATGATTNLPTAGTSELNGMDCNPTTGDCWVSDGNTFGLINPGTGVFTPLTSPGAGVDIDGLAYAPGGTSGFVYAVGGGSDSLRRYDIAAGTWAVVGSLGFATNFSGLAYDPVGGVLYMVPGLGPGQGNLYTVNTTTGVATVVGPTGFGASFIIYGLTWVGAAAPATGVDISATTPASVLYAQEIVASTSSPVTLTNTAGSLNLTSALGYSFSQGEVRYARVECPATVRFLAGSTVVASDDPASTLGAINGLGGSVITFSITADTNGLTAADTITVTGNRSITATTNASCSFSLYDNPSEAQAGGPSGRIVTRSGAYLAFGPSWQLLADPVFTSTANVEANPAFTAFVPSGDTTTARAGLAELTYSLTTPTPLRIDGTPITLADLMATGASGTRLRVIGDFGAAANVDGSYTGAALNRLFLATDDTCTTLATAASTLAESEATFNIGATAFTDDNLCLQANGTTAIQVTEYWSQVLPVAATAAYSPSLRVALASGRIVRNGTELQAPLVQLPTGFISRISLSNSGNVQRPFTWRFLPASGGTASEANTTTALPTTGSGTIPANGSLVIRLADVLGGFGVTPPRGTFVVTASAPNGQIQGLYQIVNPASGTISNHVMVRPGSN